MERNYKKDTYHHLYNRGANKLDIFHDDGDYKYFLRRLKHYSEKYSISILCYCLMPNHFHFFVKQNTAEISTGKMIGNLINSKINIALHPHGYKIEIMDAGTIVKK